MNIGLPANQAPQLVRPAGPQNGDWYFASLLETLQAGGTAMAKILVLNSQGYLVSGTKTVEVYDYLIPCGGSFYYGSIVIIVWNAATAQWWLVGP